MATVATVYAQTDTVMRPEELLAALTAERATRYVSPALTGARSHAAHASPSLGTVAIEA